MTKVFRATLLVAASLLAACGQKGDLFIPERDREAIATVPATPAQSATPAPAADEDDDAPAGPAGANGANQ